MKAKKRSADSSANRKQGSSGRPASRGWLTAIAIAVLCAGAATGAYRLTVKLFRGAPSTPPGSPLVAPASPPVAATTPITSPGPGGQPPAPVLDTNDTVQLLNYGTELLTQGKVREAVALYERAAVLSPEDEEVFFNLGVSFSRLAKMAEAARQPEQTKSCYEQARKHYERALELLPDYSEAHNNLGNVFMEQRRFDEAAKHLTAAIQANPENGTAINSLGKCLALQGKVPEALTQFEKAVGLNTNYVEGRFNLGNACMSLGRYEEAIREFEQVLILAPEFELAARRLADAKARRRVPPK